MSPGRPDAELLGRLQSAIAEQRRWERVNRLLDTGSRIVTWSAQVLALAVAFAQVTAAGSNQPIPGWTAVAVAALTAVAVSLPTLGAQLRWNDRRLIHESNAREIEVLAAELAAGTRTVEDAVERFGRLHRASVERRLREGL